MKTELALGVVETETVRLIKHPVSMALGRAGMNISMWVHDSNEKDRDIVSKNVGMFGKWEPEETQAMLDRLETVEKTFDLRREEVFLLDVGANIGWFSLNAAAAGYSVISFEPMASNLEALRRTLCGAPGLQSRVTLFAKGLNDRPGKCKFFADEMNRGNGFTSCWEDGDPRGAELSKKVYRGQFDLVVLDEFLGTPEIAPALKNRIGFFKIDVEGFEPRAFAGALKFLHDVKPHFILSEVHGPALKVATASTPDHMFQLFTDLGYDIHLHNFSSPIEPLEGLAERSNAVHRDANIYLTKRTNTQ